MAGGISTYTVTAFPVSVLSTRVLQAAVRPYTLTSSDASVLKGFKLAGDNSAYALVRFDAATKKFSRILGTPRSFECLGVPVAFSRTVFAFCTFDTVVVITVDGLAFSNAYLSAVDGVLTTTATDTLAPTTTTLQNITNKYTQSSSQQTTVSKTTSTTLKGNPSGTSHSSTVVGP